MVLDGVFERFSDKRPIPVMARVILERVLKPKKLDEWFEQTTQRQYTRELLFSSVVNIMSLVAFKASRSVHSAYRTLGEDIGVSVTSVYNKINCVETTTSRALVRDTAAEFAQMLEELKGTRSPWLPGYRVKVLDGNCIEATEHRLKVLRDTPAGPLPGKSLVVYDPSLEMAIDVFPCEDGHAQERSLLGEVIPTVQANDLWIMDRNFCVRELLAGINAQRGHFICRQHQGLPFTAKGDERFVGRLENGTVYEQWIEIASTGEGKARRYRRIRVELKRPTRNGDKELYILTSLSKSAATAKQVAEMYRRRWKIETMFQELEAHLNSEVNALGYPRAALFAFCIALVAYNALAVIKGALRRIHGEQRVADELSGYYLAGELTSCYEGMMVALSAADWHRIRETSKSEYIALLLRIASAANLERYRKTKRGPKKPRPKRNKYADKPHVSTARLLRER